jgi:ABC-2 type transport system permease protein
VSTTSQFLIRVSAFIRKEMAEILRQPRLVGTLILGPFLILLIFGVGYNNSLRSMRTIMVIPETSKIENEIRDIAGRLTGAVDMVDIISSRQEAEERLGRGEIDLILITPPDPFGDVQGNNHAQMNIIHQEIDPIEQMFVNTLERAYVEEVNRIIMIRAIGQAQDRSSDVLKRIQETRVDTQSLRDNLEDGNTAAAAQDIVTLTQDFQQISLAASSSLASFEGIQSMADDEQAETPLASLNRAEQIMLELEEFNPDKEDYGAEIEKVDRLDDELGTLAQSLSQFVNLDAAVMARPFEGTAIQLSDVAFGPIDFYVPGVISLLLQHIAITLAALSIVRERVGGAIELFRAAPVSSFETLLGKTTSFMILGAILAAVLTALVLVGLHVPMLGSWFAYVVVILALLYTSLAMGFAISSISQTDSQAVQYSMIVLLASIFFSGFFIALHRLLSGVHIVSWLLPATYGTAMLQDIMLRGLSPQPILLLGLIAYGFLLFAFAWWRLRRLMARE